MIVVSPGDVADRYTILCLKMRWLSSAYEREFLIYKKEALLHKSNRRYRNYLIALFKVNRDIWRLESGIRKGQEDSLGLAEVGKRALGIRDLNFQRVFYKNAINTLLGCEFVEIKVQHRSA